MARAKIALRPPEVDEAPTGPRYTSQLYGQNDAEAAFLSAYQSGRLHHGWLLTGLKGVGKATLAHRVARFLAAHPDHNDPAVVDATSLHVPDDHSVCRRIRARAFPDLVEIVAETTQTAAGRGRPIIKVDHIHTGLQALASTAGAGGWRVIIVDAADDLNLTAANALLKRLEEPPSRTLFLLISHAPGRLLPTIRSRCRRLELAPLEMADVKKVIAEQTKNQSSSGQTLTPQLFALSRGSAGEALSLLEQGGGEIAGELMKLVASLPQLDLEFCHKLANRLTAQKADPEFRLFCDLLLDWLADAIRAAETGREGRFASLAPSGGIGFLRKGQLAPWASLWENLGEAHAQTLGLNLDRKQFLLNSFFALESTARKQVR